MKSLTNYIFENYDTLFREIKQEQVNEGFFGWLGKLILAMFGDASEETKKYANDAFTYIDDLSGGNSEVKKQNERLLKLEKVDAFIKEIDAQHDKFIKDNVFDEEGADKWRILLLHLKIKLLKDQKEQDEDVIKKLEEYYNELIKKYKEYAEQIEKGEFPEEEKKDKNTVEAPSEEFKKGMDEALQKYDKIINELCDAIKTTPNKVVNIVYSLAAAGDDVKKIKDPGAMLAMIVMVVGAYLTKEFPERNTTINMFVGTLALLAEDNFKNIDIEQK